jgi:hypothetical protein
MIKVTREIIEIQAQLLKDFSIKRKGKGQFISVTLESCQQLIADTYGFNSWDELNKEITNNAI